MNYDQLNRLPTRDLEEMLDNIRDILSERSWDQNLDNQANLAERDWEDDPRSYLPEDNFRDDVEADADVLRMAGFGTDEDYGYYGEDYLD